MKPSIATMLFILGSLESVLAECEEALVSPGILRIHCFGVNTFSTTRGSHRPTVPIREMRLECDGYPSGPVPVVAWPSGLRGLVVENCPRMYFETVPKVSFLRMIGKNGNGSLSNFEFSSFLSKFSSLSRLEISHSRLRSLPSNLACSLSDLSLRNNDIRSVADLNFCSQNGPESVDLSGNRITSLETSSFQKLSNLIVLNISRNDLSSIDLGAFEGLLKLEVLDLSFNSIRSLPGNSFSNCHSLLKLDLSSNMLVGVSPELFVSSLTSLDLSRNNLGSDLSFKDSKNLIELDLSHNSISSLHPSTFSRCPSLEELNLSNNRLSKLSIRGSSKLTIIKVKSNSIARLDTDLIERTNSSLKSLDLSDNEIESIHPEAFSGLTKLLDLSLENNKLTYFPSEAISHISSLKALNLGKNRLIKLSDDIFTARSSLVGLKLDENAIEEIGPLAFSHLPSLKILNLAKNRLNKLSRNLFINNKELEALRLDSNKLEDIVGLLKGLPVLNWLNISSNHIDKFDWFLVPKSIEWLSLSSNFIGDIGNYFGVESEYSYLEYLDVSENNLTYLVPKALPKNLRTLSLHDNAISQIAPGTFIGMSKIERVDLYANKISHLEASSLKLHGITHRPKFYLGGNPLVCDCDLEWLITINDLNSSFPLIEDLQSIYCLSNDPTENTGSVLPLVESKDFLCTYETHCFSMCHCCDFDACDCEMTCPDGCRCYHDRSWSMNIVDCHANGFDTPPMGIPMDATEVYLAGNDFRRLSSHSFIGRKNMEILHLNSSKITDILNNTFSGLTSLRVLRLDDNSIRTLQGNEFMSLSALTELYLDNNNLEYISQNTFAYLESLKVLTLHDNMLTSLDFSVAMRPLRPFLTSLTLEGNPWNCSDCSWVKSAQISWRAIVSDSFRCFRGSFCNEINAIEGVDSSSSLRDRKPRIFAESNLPAFIVIASFAIVLIVVLGVVAYYRMEIKILSYDWLSIRPPPEAPHKDYDVYVGYSAADDQWVRSVLAVHLEEEEHYKLLLHGRDFGAQSPKLSETLITGVDNASSLVIVISQHFLKFEWSKYEVRSALHSVLRDGRSRKPVFILLGDFSLKDLDPDLRLYLKGNSSIKWRDRLFWPRLRYGLPRPTTSGGDPPGDLRDAFYAVPYPNESLSHRTLLRPEEYHHYFVGSRINTGTRIYDERNLQLAPKILERTYK